MVSDPFVYVIDDDESRRHANKVKAYDLGIRPRTEKVYRANVVQMHGDLVGPHVEGDRGKLALAMQAHGYDGFFGDVAHLA